ncbi:elongation factor EF-1 gamma subunit [Exophiala dermatitidis]|uniref:Elongation factor EF-1 gamma subunit n=2 Tax=Exophiala dermatitidis TaxID=5970 RepID=H6BY84_EXODN|nr:elongation factor EF-1 gamma subunit [Exophiala dermatitidis NIH/UT8656]KAJ4520284.1 elongation factor EF-1 gamma subunit [Exophiala dermatitidis]EHY56652.1 elongation factor EF-1 gamma subunit [Exophiala dermatitidis NIH/UT8656]KAJ4524144.1 elongation factor EF-1 gamma subunit [Exophiala dermatitidis]KAJ4525584.1 elongation factor EF-1 gamma subunit [Exophiala dermatitidis]KAJ4536902.1 elongation factor EF-1 gamma subunit [Exophiala dermatitidis]
MSFGKLYGYKDNARSTALLAVAKENNLDIELVETRPPNVDTEYLKLNPLGRIPTFVGSNGFVLTESIAIAIYFTSQNEKTTLLGKTKQDYASIVRWMSFSNSEVLPNIGGWFRPLIGRDPYNKKSVDDSKAAALKALKVLEQHLLVHTFLVGERITLADLYVTSQISRGFQYVLDKAWRSENPNTTRWFETVTAQPIWKAIIEQPILVEEAVKYTPPKKEAKPAKPAEAAPKAEKKPAEEEEEEPKPEVKAKHPLEALPKPSLILDDWKRKYSNEETREVALPWFWEHYKPEEYSLWKVDYKYNDELTMVFMSSNLIGGFFARLEASRKYLFGAMSVYGTANDSVITGAFLVRGQEALPAFDVAPDYESYEFTKLDPSKPEDRAFVEDQWAWDKPIEVNGKKYEWADGKVFK